ncbi:hypothetical protein GWI33_010126 [Rhynchophorus ferrugineus]|uniref:Uncharacterized protein n=1 Tax=Rhynchophorus ferrugineus TaxID=354439 RepID=A0A834IXM9_RHYFE|nr:hypothetical protein GWI33_010126 [Rhynchophorus ferrugineus]
MSDDAKNKRHSGGFDPLTRLGELTRLSQSTPSSPRLLPRRARDGGSSSAGTSVTGTVPRPDSLESFGVGSGVGVSRDVNWKERCLELQLELHRSRAQATRTRDMLREKVSRQFLNF